MRRVYCGTKHRPKGDPMEQTQRKKIILIACIVLAVLSALLAPLCLHLFTGTMNSLIHMSDGGWYRGKTPLVIGNRLVVSRDDQRHATRNGASKGTGSSYRVVALRLQEVASIEFIAPAADEPARDGAVPAWALGTFNIDAAGNKGYLVLYEKNGVAYGTIRFPGWGRGPVEYLSSVRIRGDRIEFVRSVSTREEMLRTGASAPFVQRYQGRYLRGGAAIDGTYSVGVNIKTWQAWR